ncbi:LD-carboxypeptidase [Ideonella sp. DXS22W]|uniref:LD-carboxypeptidase n=1 Tax=Pseudaquabacterium inlustre TaxID=2984192 RepID=A0ABU9CFN4_9BURK
MTDLHIFAPAGVEQRAPALKLARQRLAALGYSVTLDPSTRARHQRFAGDDEARLATLHRVADAAPSIAMACRGGYGMTRLLDRIDWPRIARSIERGTRWVGYSDLTAFQLGLLAHVGVKPNARTWQGPMAADDFGRSDEQGGLDEITRDCFAEAMSGELEALGFRTEAGFDGLEARGTLWGGNLAMVLSLLGTPHWPRIKGGILFLEDVNVHPYAIERGLLQLHQAGVLAAQKAVVLGRFNQWKPSPLDRGYTLKSAIARLRSECPVPVLTGLPFGHPPTAPDNEPKVTLPVGARVDLVVQGRDVLFGWHG